MLDYNFIGGLLETVEKIKFTVSPNCKKICVLGVFTRDNYYRVTCLGVENKQWCFLALIS